MPAEMPPQAIGEGIAGDVIAMSAGGQPRDPEPFRPLIGLGNVERRQQSTQPQPAFRRRADQDVPQGRDLGIVQIRRRGVGVNQKRRAAGAIAVDAVSMANRRRRISKSPGKSAAAASVEQAFPHRHRGFRRAQQVGQRVENDRGRWAAPCEGASAPDRAHRPCRRPRRLHSAARSIRHWPGTRTTACSAAATACVAAGPR